MANLSFNETSEYLALGLMSGTSLDGLDIVCAAFVLKNGKWSFSIKASETINYSDSWVDKLRFANQLNKEALISLDQEYGLFLGLAVKKFLLSINEKPDLIASHGHTVFHQPESGYTLQIGAGDEIFSLVNIPVVYNFRIADVELGGQGAPLVPIGDKLLFGENEACLNLGGFANISFETEGERKAFDICPVNTILNLYASKLGFQYDRNGEISRTGKIQVDLLKRLNNLNYYRQSFPKSLAREWLEDQFLPEISQKEYPVKDIMATVCEHIAIQISDITNNYGLKNMLVTGGGAFNKYLLEILSSYSQSKLILPDPEIINFKEALVFAFMGILKFRNEINCLASVTGAERDSVCGVLAGI